MRGGDGEYRLSNALKWIRTVAGLHYVGGAFDPEHMRGIANMAADALCGRDVKDHDEAMEEGKRWASRMAENWTIELAEPHNEKDAEPARRARADRRAE